MQPVLAMFNGWEIVAIMAVVLVLFGAKKLPELARGLGQGIKEFKKSSREIQDELNHVMDEEPPRPHTSTPQLPPHKTEVHVSEPASTSSTEERKA